MNQAIMAGIALSGVLAVTGMGMTDPHAATPVAGHRVVMHVSSSDEQVQRGVLSNVRHLYQEVGPRRLTVEVVAHGAGLSLLKKTTPFAQDLAKLKTELGVQYTACSNTMKAMQLTRADLIEEVGDTVPAIVRLMERQEQGWAYIKP